MHIIDSDDYKASGIETLFFSGGEPHVKLVKVPDDDLLLFLKLRTWNDVGIAACVIDALGTNAPNLITAFVPYLPGARQDKGVPLTSRIVGEMLYHPDIPIATFDIHSPEAMDYSMAYRNLMPTHLKIPVKDDVVGIIAPDAGAHARAEQFRNEFYPDAKLIQCSKKRNQDTGELSDYVMPPLPKKGRYIIVDDICDGGRTFNLLADEFIKDPLVLTQAGMPNRHSHLELFVSHGIFSRGLSNLHPAIEHITTTDSWCRIWQHGIDAKDRERLTILPLAQMFPILGK